MGLVGASVVDPEVDVGAGSCSGEEGGFPPWIVVAGELISRDGVSGDLRGTFWEASGGSLGGTLGVSSLGLGSSGDFFLRGTEVSILMEFRDRVGSVEVLGGWKVMVMSTSPIES